MVILRPATAVDASDVAAIWYSGWRDGHLGGVPDELLAFRTPESFLRRAADRVPDTTVATIDGSIVGFIMVERDEVEQVYVAAEQRGRGVAQILLAAAESQVRENGFEEAWLAVVASNKRARAFYARAGWADTGLFNYHAYGEARSICVPAHRYIKRVGKGEAARHAPDT
jgi:ribosomal protein S18 acetylase RimI-like enzyme